jgi:hypothetical protein
MLAAFMGVDRSYLHFELANLGLFLTRQNPMLIEAVAKTRNVETLGTYVSNRILCLNSKLMLYATETR